MVSLRKMLATIHLVEDAALIFSLAAMLVMAILQILLRNVLDSGFLWAESFLRILVLWVAMLGAMVATRERNHISIDILSRFLSGGYLVGLRIVTNLFAAAICFVTVFYALELVQYEFEDETEAFAGVPELWKNTGADGYASTPGEAVERGTALVVYRNRLILAGLFTSIDGSPLDYLATWSGSSWQPIAEAGALGMNREALALVVHEGDLVAGGNFTLAGNQIGRAHV